MNQAQLDMTDYSLRKSKQPTVLVMDSNPFTRSDVVDDLHSRGWCCLIATTGHEALDHLRAERVHAVLLEPVTQIYEGFAGIRMLALIRFLFPSIPVCCLTCHPHLASRDECLDMGATDYLVRPGGSMAQLHERLGQSLRRNGHAVPWAEARVAV